MPLSWNEIKSRALDFSKEWDQEASERAEAKSFWDGFFNIFGISRRRIATFETPIKKSDGKDGYIDLLWKGILLVEHKSRGKSLDRAFYQAKEYFSGLHERDLPRFIIVSDFANFRLYDLDTDQHYEFPLSDLYKKVQLFGFIAGYQAHPLKPEDPVNIEAAELLRVLHDQLRDIGYQGHPLELYLVRLLFCFFSEDTGICERRQFLDYLEIKTLEDGSDLANQIGALFHVLDTPIPKRLKNLDEHLAAFPYINGKLFRESLPLASFDSKMRQTLLDCCSLDWSRISPAIFGSIFQSVMDDTLRRNLGAHYTTEQNIFKVIRPLFLDELRSEFDLIKKSKGKLIEFHKRLAKMKFFDPACGCGNFLAITYREMRLLELDILRELYKDKNSSGYLDISQIVFLDVDQFYGIEIEEFPAQIAQVALWMTDHQMNLLISKEFGQYFIRLPLKKSPNIVCGNALKLDWVELVDPNDFTYIISNPPFIGKQNQNESQKEEMSSIFASVDGSGVLDFVSAWYIKAAQMMQTKPLIKAAFVSTNSITQGEQVAILWRELITQYDIRINFAHRTFQWGSEVKKGKAAVHCVIIGFSKVDSSSKIIFDYELPQSNPQAFYANNINPYLIDAPNVFLENRKKPICNVPEISFGSMPNDGGNLLLTSAELALLIKENPGSKKWVRKFMGADEFINNIDRWCLWLKDISPDELRSLPMISKRVAAVKQYRKASKRAATKKLALLPMLFGEIRQPKTDYIVIPGVSSEKRDYIPIGFFTEEVIAGNSNFCIPNASIYHFGVLTSLMHMAWVRAVCGRLESRYRYSCSLVYNNFPWPSPTEKQQKSIEEAAKKILDIRSKFTNSCLADLYDPVSMPPELVRAHRDLDRAVDISYGKIAFKSEAERVAFLFNKYKTHIEDSKNVKDPLNISLTERKYSSLDKKIILSSLIVGSLSKSKGFGRTKFAKVFYVADMLSAHNLDTKYYREANGPVDYDMLYSKKNRIDYLASKAGYFTTKKVDRRIDYILGENIKEINKDIKLIFGEEAKKIKKLIALFSKLDVEQSEVVATLFACWNDLLLERAEITNERIINEVRNNWHLSKKRFTEERLRRALVWMNKNLIIPMGKKSHTLPKPVKN